MKKAFCFLVGIYWLAAGCGNLPGLNAFDEKTDWKTYTSPDFGISLDSPYPIQFTTKEQKDKAGFTFKSLTGRSSLSEPEVMDILVFTLKRLAGEQALMNLFQLDVWSRSGGNPKVSYNSQLFVDSTVKSMDNLQKRKGCQNFQYKNIPLTCSGMPATLTSGSFDIQRQKITVPMYFHSLLVVDKNRYWQIYCTYQNDAKYGETFKKILQSVKINFNS